MRSFEEIRKEINIYTAVDDNRLKVLYQAVQMTYPYSEPMAEIGVYKGGSSYLLSRADPDRLLYACDTFTGLPEPTKNDEGTIHKVGDFNDSHYEQVCNFLEATNVNVRKGYFPDFNICSEFYCMYWQKFSLVHLDLDLYQSTLDSLEFFYDKMIQGGVIVVDDYGWKDTPGVKKAIDEFFSNKPEKVIDTGFNNCFIVKA